VNVRHFGRLVRGVGPRGSLRGLVCGLVLGLAGGLPAGRAAAQSSFESDPFGSRFRERSSFEMKFKLPEKGGSIKVTVPEGEGGRQSLVSENVWDAEAPPGKFVTVEYQDIRLTARKIRADTSRYVVIAEGEVVFEQGASRMTGSRLDLDLNDKTGILTDGSVDLEGGMHVRGEMLAKVGPRSYTMAGATLTACDGERPPWQFDFSTGRITLEEYARLSHVTFRLAGLPVLYVPYLLWPAMQNRSSGFMIPAIGYSSDRGGFLGLAYFLTLGRSADATLSTETYTNGTFGFGGELRAKPSKGTTFEGTFFTVDDQNLGGWGWKTRGKAVSDDLAPGLRGVVSWLDFSSLDFFQNYEHDFQLSSTRSIKSEAFLTYGRDPISLNLRLDHERTVFDSTGAYDVVTERKPVLEARLRPTPLFGQSLFLEMTGQAGQLHIDRGVGQPVGTYGRLDLFPQVSIPLSPIPWLSAQADAGARVTWWGDSIDPANPSAFAGQSYTRELVHIGLQVTGPSFSRIFETKLGPFTKLKHVIEPRFDYDYMNDPTDLARAPLFDEVDTVSPTHQLRYSLVQRLLAKGKDPGSREIASLEIGRTYYFRAPDYGAAGPPPDFSTNSPVDAILRVNPTPSLNLDARTTWDTKAGQVTSASLSANLNAKDKTLSLSYFSSRPTTCVPTPDYPCASTQIRVFGGMPIIPKRLRLDVQWNYDLSLSKPLEFRGLMTVEANCFKVLFEYRDLRLGTIPSRDIRIGLNLKNIGSFLDFPISLP
jgi:LPS-assembly protein